MLSTEDNGEPTHFTLPLGLVEDLDDLLSSMVFSLHMVLLLEDPNISNWPVIWLLRNIRALMP